MQVYSQIIRCMVIFDEKRYASACLEPPVPKCYLAQLDAQNDVLVLENLEHSGYKKYAGGKYFSDVDHCKVVLRRIAHFHAFSTLIQVSQHFYFSKSAYSIVCTRKIEAYRKLTFSSKFCLSALNFF